MGKPTGSLLEKIEATLRDKPPFYQCGEIEGKLHSFHFDTASTEESHKRGGEVVIVHVMFFRDTLRPDRYNATIVKCDWNGIDVTTLMESQDEYFGFIEARAFDIQRLIPETLHYSNLPLPEVVARPFDFSWESTYDLKGTPCSIDLKGVVHEVQINSRWCSFLQLSKVLIDKHEAHIGEAEGILSSACYWSIYPCRVTRSLLERVSFGEWNQVPKLFQDTVTNPA